MKRKMKKYKSHFVYTKNQRNGILLLLVLIVLLQVALSINVYKSPVVDTSFFEAQAFQHQIDRMKEIAIENRKPKIYPFNPNFISDDKGYQLGMSIQEIDRLHHYRAQGMFVNSQEEFQEVTKVSDSLLNTIAPYFKFPSWVKKTPNKKKHTKTRSFNHITAKEKSHLTTNDLNKASLEDFLGIENMDEGLAERILKYRTKLQGFTFEDQIFEVWGISDEIGQEILATFTIKTLPKIQPVNINTASFKEVLKIPYIDYNLCVKIFDYRDEVAEIQSILELKNIEGFPLDKYDRIVVYLSAQ